MEDAEEIKRLAKTRKEIREKNREKYKQRYLEFALHMDRERRKTLELMRRRHAYYTKLITDAEIKTAQDFYDRFKELFLMYGVELELSDNKKWCSIYLELGDYYYENYHVGDGKDDSFAEVDPEVSFKEMFENVEVNIFTREEL